MGTSSAYTMKTNLAVVVVIVLAATTFTTTQAAVAMGPAKLNEDCPGQCWDGEHSKCVAVGETFPPSKGCMSTSCTKYKGKLFIEHTTCGSVGVPDGCRVVEDLSLSYPDCCPKPNCDKIESQELDTEPEYQELENDAVYQEFNNWLEQAYPNDHSIEKNSIEI